MDTSFNIITLDEFREFVKSGGELSSIPLLIFFCLVFGTLFKKIRLPSIMGYMCGGLVMGSGGLDFISDDTSKTLSSFTQVALGLMVLTIGTHINFHRLKNSGFRILACSFFDNLLPFALVFSVMYFLLDQSLVFSFIIGTFAVSTAPDTTIAMVQETRSKGTLTNTLLPLVAVNNVVCIILFSFTISYLNVPKDMSSSIADVALSVLKLGGGNIIKGITIGVIMGYALKWYADRTSAAHPGELLTGIFFLIMATTGLSIGLHINPMLPCLFMGIYITNVGTRSSAILNTFEEIQHIILLIFFGFAGTHIDFGSFPQAGLLIGAYLLARFTGKYLGSTAGSLISRAPLRLTKYLGMATIPQAGLVIGLLVLAYEIPQLQSSMTILTAVMIVAVSVNEIVGPILTKVAFVKSGEAEQDRGKLIDFLGEEFILSNMKSTDKVGALEELVRFLLKSHNISQDRYEEFRKAVFDREKQQSTGIGNGVAIPHGTIDEEKEILGVMGLSKQGIECDAPDGRPAHLFILLLTPKDQGTKHLKILAEMVKLVGDSYIRERLFRAKTAAELYEVIHDVEHDTFNYFMEEK